MWAKIICTILVINSYSTFSKGSGIPEQGQNKDSDIKILKADARYLRERVQSFQDLLMDYYHRGAYMEYDIKTLPDYFQSLNEELKKQQMYEDYEESDSKILRAELERLKNDIINMDSNIQKLEAELKQQKKREVDNESLRAEVERLRKLVDGLVNPPNCTEAKSNGINEILLPNFSNQSFKVAYDVETRGGGWTIILRRLDGSVNFNRNWTEYKNGFGNLNGEFFLGLDKIHAITAERTQELLVVLEDFEGDNRYETYDDFAVGDEGQQYELLTVGKANGTAGDSLTYHQGSKFSTFDQNNDKITFKNCAKEDNGAWWYFDCHYSHLTGKYNDNTSHKGVNWYDFRGHEYSLKTAVMMIRPRK
ncbi:ficolin-2-like isoform X1 [Drosophila innubila]|uniref:ficolin-2-like isoform X1 n=1 Tax=Drosophila innubila TaxID=198719 RepID=UPI00148E001B|nr:ficolin-2-like isoform X1 [Drosophila innubila]